MPREDDLQRELERLIERVERIERRLSLPPEIKPVAAPPAERAAPVPPPVPAAPPTQPLDETPVVAPPSPQVPLVTQLKGASADRPPTAPPIAPPDFTTPPKKRGKPKRDRARAEGDGRAASMEMLIGVKWAAWVGAIVIVIATALLIKLGYDAGIWTRMSELTRCLLVAAFGAALLIGAEVALRRISKPASVGLFGAGLGVLYLDGWATTEYFELLSKEWAFVLMAVTAAAGFLITLRTRFLTIGVLALVGGYLTPILLRGSGGHDLEVLAFLTALFATALALSLTSPRPFRPLRYVALGGQALLGFIWVVDSGAALWLTAVIFFSMWWSMLLVEVTVAALRRQSPLGNPLAILIATACYVTAVCWLLSGAAPAGDSWRGIFTAAIAALGAATALQFGPGLDALRAPPKYAMDKLSVALIAQSGVLLVVAVALQFDDFALVIGWLAIAVAAIEVGRRLPSRGVDVFGIVVWFLGMSYAWLLRLAMLAGMTSGLSTKVVRTSWLLVDRWSILMLIGIAVSFLAAHRLSATTRRFRETTPRPRRVMPVLFAAAGAASWLVLCAIQCEGLAATAAWLVGVAVLLAVHPFGRRQGYLQIALVALLLAGAKWLLFDAIVERSARGWDASDRALIFNGQMAIALAIAVVGAWATWIMNRRTTADPPAQAARGSWSIVPLIAGALVVLVGLSFEIDRAVSALSQERLEALAYPAPLLRALWWTGLWTVGGAAMIIAGRRPPFLWLGHVGWLLLVASAVAWLTYDTVGRRLTEGPVAASVVFNIQFGAGVLLVAALALVLRWGRATREERSIHAPLAGDPAPVGFALLALIGLWLGSIEIDRGFADDSMAMQAGLSVYWALYGVMLVIVGFIWRSAAARYAGLALLAITVVKVVIIDLSTIQKVWRVISFFASGLLLVGTSILYTTLSPRLLAEHERELDDDGDTEVR